MDKNRILRRPRLALLIVAALIGVIATPTSEAAVTAADVERSIRDGIAYLRNVQNPDGSWSGQVGTSALVTLALLTAGEPVEAPHMVRALNNLRRTSPMELNNTYAVSLQVMAFAAADPGAFRGPIAQGANWLEKAQIRGIAPAAIVRDGRVRGVGGVATGSWSYTLQGGRSGDNSNSQYALLGLHAASEAGVRVDPAVLAAARRHWQGAQGRDGGWGYRSSDGGQSTGSMTCAGLSSLLITGLKRYQNQETLVGDAIHNCGTGGFDPDLRRGVDWLAANFRVTENPGSGQTWRYYYLYGLERVGRLSGLRFIGRDDWYREGAEVIVREQDRFRGYWAGGGDAGPVVSSSFALLFLAKGRSPVVVNKIRHGPGGDWDNDPDDVRNLVDAVSRDWDHLLTWQVVDPGYASVEDMLQAPIAFLNGHEAPTLAPDARVRLREYIEQGGFLLAEACCGRAEFDRGFRALIAQVFPEPEYRLRPLPPEHPIWRSRFALTPEVHPLWGIEHGCRTVVVYSPGDLSCYWNQMNAHPDSPAVIKAQRVGQNVVDYATGREVVAKLELREVVSVKADSPRRGARHIAKLKHAGDWNVAPLAVPNLTTALRDGQAMDVLVDHRAIMASDPNLIHYPLLYVHGRAGISFGPDDLLALRRHLDPGGGTIFADAACGSPAFDAAFRRFVAELFPGRELEPIPADDPLYTRKIGYDLSNVQYTKAAGGGRDRPQLEGVQIDGHWAIIYSRLDIGCALERQQALDCKGYTHEDALRIAANIVLYATMP